MTIEELRERLGEMLSGVDESITILSDAAANAQAKIYAAIMSMVNKLDISEGRLVPKQDYAGKLLAIERQINVILDRVYHPALGQYFSQYQTVQKENVVLQKAYNDIAVDESLLTPARRAVYDQALYYLQEGLAPNYVQPAKYLLMQQVTTGIRIDDATRQWRNWNEGTLGSSGLASARTAPNLQKYAVQISRDSIHQYNGAINNIIATEYELDHFIYVGGTVKDSRPFCRHLVGLRRIISIDEIPELVVQFPQGLYPDTNRKNFFQVRGGYNCIHEAYPTRKRK